MCVTRRTLSKQTEIKSLETGISCGGCETGRQAGRQEEEKGEMHRASARWQHCGGARPSCRWAARGIRSMGFALMPFPALDGAGIGRLWKRRESERERGLSSVNTHAGGGRGGVGGVGGVGGWIT